MVMFCFSFKPNTDFFIRIIYYITCMLTSKIICLRKLTYWEESATFKGKQQIEQINNDI